MPTGGKPAGIGSWTSTPVSPEGSTRMRSLEGKLTWYHKDVHRKARLCGPSVGIASRRPVVSRSTSRSILAACPNHSLVKEVGGRSHPPKRFAMGRRGILRKPQPVSTHTPSKSRGFGVEYKPDRRSDRRAGLQRIRFG